MSIVYAFDLYPRANPVSGARVLRFSKLQEAEYRGEANGTGSGRIILRGTSTDAASIDPKGMQYIRVERLGDAITLAVSAAADDIIDTAAAHGLAVGNKIEFVSLTGGAGLSTTPVYFVISVPTSTSLTISATRGGASVNFTTDITAGTIRRLYTAGGFFLENGDYEALTERSTKKLTFGGAGALSYLSRAIAAEDTYIAGADGPFDGLWHWYISTAGSILWRMVTEALDVDRPQSPIAGMTLTFGQSLDSDGNSWPGYGTSWLFTAQVGEGLVSIMRRLMEAGVYVWMDPDTFALSAWMANAHGRTRTGVVWGTNVVRFQAPTDGTIATGNIKSDAKRGIGALIKRSDLLVGSSEGYAWVNDPAADLVWEGGFPVDDPNGGSLAAIGAAQLDARNDAGDTVRLRMFIGASPTTGAYLPFETAGILLDDRVTLHTGTGQWDWNETEQKVAAITLKLRPGGDWDAWVDLGSQYSSIESRAFQVGGSGCNCSRLLLCDPTVTVETSSAWKMHTSGTPPAGWEDAGFDDSAYANAINVSNGGGPWYDFGSSRWIWQDEATGTPPAQPSAEERSFRREFYLSSVPSTASLLVAADNGCEVYLNGTLIATHGGSERGTTDASPFNYAAAQTVSVSPAVFVAGTNCISIIGWNETNALPGPAGVYAVLTVGAETGAGSRAARCDHGHVHNTLSGRDTAEAHPAAGVTDSGGTTVQAALDSLRAGGWKQSVRVSTAAAGTLATSFENGDTIDGVVLATGNRILLKDQAAGAENGIYTVNASGAPTRATDMDASAEVLGAVVLVEEGTANADKIFRCTNNATIVLGTTALVFTELSGGGLAVQEDDSTVDAAVTTLDFTTALNVTSSPAGEANVSVDLGTASTQAAAGNHTHTAGDSAKASATADLSGTTTTAADVTGATLSLGAGTYIVAGNFQVELNSGDRIFEGVLDVATVDENDLAIWEAIGADDGDDQQVVQFWRITLGSTSTVKLQARHSGGTTGDFDVKAANTTITAWTSGGSLGVWTDYTPTLTAVTTNPTLGSSVVSGRYKALDAKTYIVEARLVVTTGGAWNAGSGEYKFSLPSGLTAAGARTLGSASVLDSGTARFTGTATCISGQTVIWPTIIADSTGDRVLKHNLPVTWATGDEVDITIIVEVA